MGEAAQRLQEFHSNAVQLALQLEGFKRLADQAENAARRTVPHPDQGKSAIRRLKPRVIITKGTTLPANLVAAAQREFQKLRRLLDATERGPGAEFTLAISAGAVRKEHAGVRGESFHAILSCIAERVATLPLARVLQQGGELDAYERIVETNVGSVLSEVHELLDGFDFQDLNAWLNEEYQRTADSTLQGPPPDDLLTIAELARPASVSASRFSGDALETHPRWSMRRRGRQADRSRQAAQETRAHEEQHGYHDYKRTLPPSHVHRRPVRDPRAGQTERIEHDSRIEGFQIYAVSVSP